MSEILSKVKAANVWEKKNGEGSNEVQSQYETQSKDETFDEIIKETGDRIILTYDEMNEKEALKYVGDPSAGANVLFVGCTRNEFQGKSVQRLEYTSYSSLAKKMMKSLIKEERERWKKENEKTKEGENQSNSQNEIKRIYLAHRLGNVETGEASILIAVSSAHRRAAFTLCEAILEEVKRQVPIWKKEIYDGENAGSGEWKANDKTYWERRDGK